MHCQLMLPLVLILMLLLSWLPAIFLSCYRTNHLNEPPHKHDRVDPSILLFVSFHSSAFFLRACNPRTTDAHTHTHNYNADSFWGVFRTQHIDRTVLWSRSHLRGSTMWGSMQTELHAPELFRVRSYGIVRAVSHTAPAPAS